MSLFLKSFSVFAKQKKREKRKIPEWVVDDDVSQSVSISKPWYDHWKFPNSEVLPMLSSKISYLIAWKEGIQRGQSGLFPTEIFPDVCPVMVLWFKYPSSHHNVFHFPCCLLSRPCPGARLLIFAEPVLDGERNVSSVELSSGMSASKWWLILIV